MFLPWSLSVHSICPFFLTHDSFFILWNQLQLLIIQGEFCEKNLKCISSVFSSSTYTDSSCTTFTPLRLGAVSSRLLTAEKQILKKKHLNTTPADLILKIKASSSTVKPLAVCCYSSGVMWSSGVSCWDSSGHRTVDWSPSARVTYRLTVDMIQWVIISLQTWSVIVGQRDQSSSVETWASSAYVEIWETNKAATKPQPQAEGQRWNALI